MNTNNIPTPIEDQISDLTQEYYWCCNMRYHMYRFECALWRIHSDNPSMAIMDMITTAKSLQDAYAHRANEIRDIQIAALGGWD